MFTCEKCEKTFKYKSKYERHINKVKGCFDDDFCQISQKGTEAHRGALKIECSEKIENSEEITTISNNHKKCDFCKNIMLKRCFNRHVIYTCKKVPKYIRENFIVKYNTNGNTSKESKISLQYFRSHNEINNANLINIKNFNDFNNDDYSHLTCEDMVNLCNSGYKSYTLLIELLAKNKKNVNFMIENKNKNEIYVIKDQKIDIITKHEFKEGKLDRLLGILGDIIIKNEVITKVSDKNKEKVKDIIRVDKYKQSVRYNEYSDEVYRNIKKYNSINKDVFKKILSNTK